MSEHHDRQIQQTADQALREIARCYDYAIQAVWHHYPPPQPRHAHPEQPTPSWPAGPDAERSP